MVTSSCQNMRHETSPGAWDSATEAEVLHTWNIVYIYILIGFRWFEWDIEASQAVSWSFHQVTATEENQKLTARPFPVKKYGLERAKVEVLRPKEAGARYKENERQE